MAIDLEHFPTNETALRMMERISPIYERSYVGKWIFEIMGMEMGEARAYFEELRQQPFPERTTWAIEYWERRYVIIPKPTDDLETRRKNIIMKRGARLPMNPARLELNLDGITSGRTTVKENVDDYTFSVTIEDVDAPVDVEAVIKHIKKVKPSHQTFEFYMAFRRQTQDVRIGGAMATITRIPIPEMADTFVFEGTLHTGGQMAAVHRLPVPELPDTFVFEGTLRTGGQMAAVHCLPMPELQDTFSFKDTLHTGGQMATIHHLPVPELQDTFSFEDTVRTGGQMASIHTIPIQENTTSDTLSRTGRVGVRGAVTTTIPLPEMP